jgi:hypothetical protein
MAAIPSDLDEVGIIVCVAVSPGAELKLRQRAEAEGRGLGEVATAVFDEAFLGPRCAYCECADTSHCHCSCHDPSA